MRLALPAVLALVGVPACLDPNPDFDDGGSTSIADDNTSAPGDASSEGGCTPEPTDTGDDTEEPLVDGEFSYVLEETSTVDAFNMWVEGAGMRTVHFETDVALDLCAYADCEVEPGLPPPCVPPVTSDSLDDTGLFGCCNSTVLDLSFDCPADAGAKLHVRVSGADAACTAYQLEVATTNP